ncbi:MAG TPA: 50S ribosomal protein L4 [Phycisphaerales bacterium]|nr:50S ribosomal protein L4 [Phycisphaerales bacterium]
MEVPVYNIQGQQVASISIDEKSLGGDVNPALVKQAYVRYHTHTRQGSSKTKNRHEVEGSTRKLYKQKGTGNARHGDRKANLFKGGGHGHSKKRVREDWRLDMPKKMRRKANRNALLAKLVDSEVRVIDGWAGIKEPRTAAFRDFLGALKVDNTALVALPMDFEKARVAMLSARNIDEVELARVDQMNAFNLLNNRYLVIAREDLEAWLKGPTSQTGKEAKVNPLGRVSGEKSEAPVRGPGSKSKLAKKKAEVK